MLGILVSNHPRFEAYRQSPQMVPNTTNPALPTRGCLKIKDLLQGTTSENVLPHIIGSHPLANVGDELLSPLPSSHCSWVMRESVKGIVANTSVMTSSWHPARPADGTSRVSDTGMAEKRRDESDGPQRPTIGRESPYMIWLDLRLGGLLSPHCEMPSASGE